jgi:hypothetical protein
MRRKMNQVERTAPAAPVTAPRGQRQTQAPILPPPPSTLSSDKQQKLTELLQRYRNDELSPEEYHRERQKLLSAP